MLDLHSVREQIGVVFQDPLLFAGTIRENITLGDTSLTPDDVVAAAKSARLHDEVISMPMGYDTLLTDRGSALSGGQRQRVALTRALVRKPSVLLLDEATSALDTITEHQVQSALDAPRVPES